MLVKVGRALGLGAGAVLGSGLTYSLYQSEGDISNIGAVRFGRAAVAVGRIAVDYKRTLSSQFLSEESYEEAKSECHLRSAKHLLKLCCDNGGVFVKVGQHIGALDYLLPEEYVNTMKVLHNRSPQMPLDDIYSVLREELGQDVRWLLMIELETNCVCFSQRKCLPALTRSRSVPPAWPRSTRRSSTPGRRWQ